MNLGEIGAFLFVQPLLALAALAILLAALGWLSEARHPAAAHWLRLAGYAGMIVVVLLTVVEAAHRASRSDMRMATGKVGMVTVAGVNTVVPIDPSGHYWIKAELNGKEAAFLIDTGATYTTISPETARASGITADPARMPIVLNTANGPINARFAIAPSLRFGTIEAQRLDVVIGPELDDQTNVIGMNLLTKLKGWRVEGDRLVLVPG